MAGKAARERRRLQRLDEAVTEAAPNKTNHNGGRQTPAYDNSQKNDPTGSINHHNRYATKQYPSSQQRDTRYQRGAPSKSQPNGTTRAVTSTTAPNKKFKKPKHLKRKLAQLDSVPETSEEDQELRSRLLRQAKVLEEVKQKRSLKFQARLKELAGDKFDNDTFQHLTQTGASTKTILEAVGVTATDATTTTTTTTTTTPSLGSQKKETTHPNESVSLKSKATSKSKPNVSNTDNDAKEKHRTATPAATATATTPDDSDASSSCPSSSGSDNDSSDSEGEAVQEETRRTRGRGKKRTREVIENSTDTNDNDSAPASPSKSHVKANDDIVSVVDKKAKTTTTATKNKDEITDVKKPKKVPDPSKKTPKKDDKRRCIGRKPVTEFELGKRYNGKVMYVKSFGAFLDIGCHSDAFVHISHVQDDFVKADSISNLLEVGAQVSARVVEIDRTKKRITASLQSDEKLDAAEERKKQKMQAQMQTSSTHHKPSGAKRFDFNNSKIPIMEPSKMEPKVEVKKNEADMTPAELKRARKLARRADRREQKETTGISA